MLVCVCGVNCFRQGKHIRHSIDTIPLFESSGNVIVAWMFSRLVRVNKNPSPPPPCVTFYISLSLSHTHFNAARLCIPVIDGNLLRSFYFILFLPNTPGNLWWIIDGDESFFPWNLCVCKILFFFLLPAPRKSLIIRNVTQSRFLALHIRGKKKTNPHRVREKSVKKMYVGERDILEIFLHRKIEKIKI